MLHKMLGFIVFRPEKEKKVVDCNIGEKKTLVDSILCKHRVI